MIGAKSSLSLSFQKVNIISPQRIVNIISPFIDFFTFILYNIYIRFSKERIKMDLKDYLQESELEKIADELNKVERERIFGKEDY